MTGPVLSGGAALVGLDAEIALLNARLDEAVAGHGGIVLLAGEPGIGKTWLAEAFAATASDRGALAFRPWIEILPAWARTSPRVAEVLPLLYLR